VLNSLLVATDLAPSPGSGVARGAGHAWRRKNPSPTRPPQELRHLPI